MRRSVGHASSIAAVRRRAAASAECCAHGACGAKVVIVIVIAARNKAFLAPNVRHEACFIRRAPNLGKIKRIGRRKKGRVCRRAVSVWHPWWGMHRHHRERAMLLALVVRSAYAVSTGALLPDLADPLLAAPAQSAGMNYTVPADQLIVPPLHTVSGFSTGGTMALAHLMSFAPKVRGAGINDGRPLGFNDIDPPGPPALANATQALLTTCINASSMCDEGALGAFRMYLLDRERRVELGPLAALKQSRLFLYHSSAGPNTAKMHAMAAVLSPWTVSARIRKAHVDTAGHGWPVAQSTAARPCNFSGPPYILDCDGYDLGAEMLPWLLGETQPPTGLAEPPNVAQRLWMLETAPYMPAGTGSDPAQIDLGVTAYVYVPKACEREGGVRCKLHVDYHGSFTANEGTIAGLEPPWSRAERQAFYILHQQLHVGAEAYHVVILYPRSRPTLAEDPPALASSTAYAGWGGLPQFDRISSPQLQTIASQLAYLRARMDEGGLRASLKSMQPSIGASEQEILLF